MEPFKNLINATTVANAGLHLQRAWTGFNRAHFESLANSGLHALELKARMLQLADVPDVHMDLGHVGIYRGLARAAGLSGEVEQQARRVMRLTHDLSVVGLNLCHE